MNKHSQTVFFYRETQKHRNPVSSWNQARWKARPLHKTRSLARWSQHSSAIAPPESPERGALAIFVLRRPPGVSWCLALVGKCFSNSSEAYKNKNKNKVNIPGSKDVLFGEINSRNHLHSENTWLSLLEKKRKSLRSGPSIGHCLIQYAKVMISVWTSPGKQNH